MKKAFKSVALIAEAFPHAFLSLILWAGMATCSGQERLRPDLYLEEALAGGQSHSYTIVLSAGDYLYVIVEQKGIDIEAVLTSPDGRTIAHMDSPNEAWGPEPVAVIANGPGEYQLAVRSGDRGAPAGKYELRVLALRPASAEDREHVAANQDVEQAYDLMGRGSPDALRKAATKLEAAIPFYHSHAFPYDEAISLYSLGQVQARLGDFHSAADSYALAVPLFKSTAAKAMTGLALNNLGGAYDVLGDPIRSLNLYREALPFLHTTPSGENEGSVLNNIGKIHADFAEWQEAESYYRQALPIFQRIGDRGREAVTLTNLGTITHLLGRDAESMQYYERALSLHREAGNKTGEIETLSQLGVLYRSLHSPELSLKVCSEGLNLAHATGDHWREGRLLSGIGLSYLALDRVKEGYEALHQSLDLLSQTDDTRNQALAWRGMGDAALALRDSEGALQAYRQAFNLFQRVGDRHFAALALLGQAKVERNENQLQESGTHASQALSLIEQVRSRAGAQEDRASYFATQQSMGEFYIDLLMRMHKNDPQAAHDAEAFNAAERARARSLLEMLAEARVDFRRGVDPKLLEREHELSGLLNAKSQKLLTLRGAGTDEKAAALKKEINDLESEYQQVELAIRKSSPEYAAITQPQPLTLKEVQHQVLDSESVLLEYSLGGERSYLFAVSQNGLKTYELPARAEIDKAVRRVHELLTARSQYIIGETAQEKQARIAKSDQEFPAAAAALSKMVLAPASADLANNEKRLVLVADGALQTVPFAVLPVPDGNSATPLVAQHELVSLPSASTVDELRKEIAGRKPAPGLVAVFADPVFAADDPRVQKSQGKAPKEETVASVQPGTAGSDDSRMLKHLASGASASSSGRLEVPRLPFTREEATRITKMVPAGENFEALDFNASLKTVNSSMLGRYRYLHFATHGYLDTERPELSSIVLSLVDKNGRPQDGFLRAQDIYNLKLNADLVVLSACETGLGKEIRGEGIVGLTRGFMYAGAPRVIVSMWSVNDRATEELMGAFYERLFKRGMRPSAALRQAQVEMWKSKKWSAPYYWGAFVQQGEWR